MNTTEKLTIISLVLVLHFACYGEPPKWIGRCVPRLNASTTGLRELQAAGVDPLHVVVDESSYQENKCSNDQVLFSVQVRALDSNAAIKHGFDELPAQYGIPLRKSVH